MLQRFERTCCVFEINSQNRAGLCEPEAQSKSVLSRTIRRVFLQNRTNRVCHGRIEFYNPLFESVGYNPVAKLKNSSTGWNLFGRSMTPPQISLGLGCGRCDFPPQRLPTHFLVEI